MIKIIDYSDFNKKCTELAEKLKWGNLSEKSRFAMVNYSSFNKARNVWEYKYQFNICNLMPNVTNDVILPIYPIEAVCFSDSQFDLDIIKMLKNDWQGKEDDFDELIDNWFCLLATHLMITEDEYLIRFSW